MISLNRSLNIFKGIANFMSSKENHHGFGNETKNLKNSSIKRNSDVVDRFLSVLWRREVDWKLTFK